MIQKRKKGLDEFATFGAPTVGFSEQVYFHDVAPDADGFVHSALINKEFNDGQGFGFYIKYRKEQLPVLIEWKMTGEGIYVIGMEPGTNRVDGRSLERKEGRLIFLKPGETRSYHLEIGVLAGQEEIAAFEDKVDSIR